MDTSIVGNDSRPDSAGAPAHAYLCSVCTSAYTGVVLAGGSSSRLGQNKAQVRIAGCSLIERVVDVLRPLVSDIVLVTQSQRSTRGEGSVPSEDSPFGERSAFGEHSAFDADLYAHLGLPVVSDIYPGVGTLGGLHAGLNAIDTEYGLVVGCDMPFLNADLLRYMMSQARGYDVVMPRVGTYHEPLHALYARRCLSGIERSILAGRRRILHALAEMRIRYIEEPEIDRYDPDHWSFFNVNTPDELERARALLVQ